MPYWEIGNVWAYLRESTEEDQRKLYNLLRTRPKNYFFDFRFRNGLWDGYNYFFDRTRCRILTGLLDTVEQMGFHWEQRWVTSAQKTNLIVPAIEGIQYAPLQRAALEAVCAGKHRGIFDIVTGYGKALCIAATIKALDLPALVIVPSIELLSQLGAEITRFTGLECSRIGGGHNEKGGTVKIVTDDSLKRLPDWRLAEIIEGIKVIHMDEVHNCTDKLQKFLNQCEDVYYRYGWSGTPFDMGKDRAANLLGIFGPVLIKASSEDLVDAKRGVPAHFIFVDVHLGKIEAPDYTALYEECVVQNLLYHRQVVDITKRHADGETSILILVKRIEHGTELLKLLQQEKIECEFVSGKHHPATRTRVKEQFKAGKLKIVIASDIYKEGVDIPCIDVLILAVGGKSLKDWKQRVGRGLRAHPGKDKVVVYDFMFHGTDQCKIMHKHSKERLKAAMELEGAKVFRFDSFLNQLVAIDQGVTKDVGLIPV